MKILLISLILIQVTLIILGIDMVNRGHLGYGIFNIVINFCFLLLNIHILRKQEND